MVEGYICPDCQSVTYHPTDIQERFCGRCKTFGRLHPNASKLMRLVVEDGKTNSFKLYDADGAPIQFGRTGVRRIEIDPFVPNGIVTMHITLVAVDVSLSGVKVALDFDKAAPDTPA